MNTGVLPACIAPHVCLVPVEVKEDTGSLDTETTEVVSCHGGSAN